MAYKILDEVKSKKNEKKPDFVIIEPEWTLDEIILSQRVKDQISDVISFCKNKDRIIHEWELKRFLKGSGGCIAVNFWGLPGTGKSIAAEAIANALGKKLIQASYASIMDSLQGKTEKNLTNLFETAVKEDCVILFDEADGLLSARKTTSNSDSTNLIKSHLLNILDRSSAIVVFTTNFFKSYDRAFVRRILWNIEVAAPSIPELTKLWEFHLGKNIPKTIGYSELADLSYQIAESKNMKITGGDIRKLTLTFCTKLTSKRFTQIDVEIARNVISTYLDDLQETVPQNKNEKPVLDSELSDKIKSELQK